MPSSRREGQRGSARSGTVPLDEPDGGPHAGLGGELELVDEPAGPRKAEPETVAGRVSVRHRQLDVVDARTFVAGDDLDALPRPVAHDPQGHLATAGVG